MKYNDFLIFFVDILIFFSMLFILGSQSRSDRIERRNNVHDASNDTVSRSRCLSGDLVDVRIKKSRIPKTIKMSAA
jgi:hypothetical protein